MFDWDSPPMIAKQYACSWLIDERHTLAYLQ